MRRGHPKRRVRLALSPLARSHRGFLTDTFGPTTTAHGEPEDNRGGGSAAGASTIVTRRDSAENPDTGPAIASERDEPRTIAEARRQQQ